MNPYLRLAIFIAFSLITRALFFPVEILDMDEAAHAVGSWTFMNGGLLYEDFINNKPPLLYVYYALAQILFGKGLISVHILTALAVVPLTAFAASAFFDHNRTGYVAGVLYLIFSASFLAHDMHSSNAEILMVLPGAWAIVLVRNQELAESRWRMLVSGLLFGIGFLLKYQIALGILAVAAGCLKVRRRSWIYLLPGFLIPPLITLWIFQSAGGLDQILYWLFWNNLLYSANPISFSEAVGRGATYLLPFLLLTAPLWWFWIRSRGKFDDYRKTITTMLIFISIPPVFIGFRFYPHYFIQLYFPLILAASPEIMKSIRRRAVLLYAGVLFLFCTAVNAYLYFGNQRVYRELDPVYKTVAKRLKQDSCYDNGSIFVWGYAPAFYYYSGLQPASRFVVMGQARLTGYVSGNLGSLDRASQGVPEHWEWLMMDLKKKDVTYILDTAPAAIYRWNHFPLKNFPLLKNFIDDGFEQLDVVDDVVIYRSRSCDKS